MKGLDAELATGGGPAHGPRRPRGARRGGLKLDPDELTNPWHAAGASALAFIVGSLAPLLTILLIPGVVGMGHRGGGGGRPRGDRVPSATLGGARSARPAPQCRRGLVAMAITFAIGSLVGMRLD